VTAAYEYVVADVFTDVPLAGNQLAVFPDAASVPDELLQPLAKEIGFSETVFVYAGDRVRIFTPGTELPFAGHPVLGTAFVLADRRGAKEIELTTNAGPVTVAFDGGRGRFTRPEPDVSQWDGDADALYAALGVRRSRLPVEAYVNGPRHVYVTLDSVEAVAALTPDLTTLAAVLPDGLANCIAGEGRAWKTRVFGPAVGVPEDPATGSAAGPLALHVCRHGVVPWETELTITQGVEIGRPSTLYALAHEDGSVDVAGDTVIVATGAFAL
jgi:trans-2,3-dihydro-3-hydroxyanthranilate isomerase